MSKRLSFAVVLVVIAMLAVACGGGGSQSNSSNSSATSSASGQSIQVSLADFKFAPATITVKRGTPVTLSLKNDGAVAHDLAIEDLGVASELVRPGQSSSVTFTPNTAGQFDIICTEPGHLASGMKATLIVE